MRPSATKPNIYTLYLKTTIIDWKTHHLLSKRERDCTNIKKPWEHEEKRYWLTCLLFACLIQCIVSKVKKRGTTTISTTKLHNTSLYAFVWKSCLLEVEGFAKGSVKYIAKSKE